MSAEQGSSKVLTLMPSDSATDVLQDLQAPQDLPGAETLPAPEAQDLPSSEAIDTRTLSRSLFLRLAALDDNSPERAYVRDTLIELNLPLVRYAAARFRSRNEPMEDIVQVGTIGLIKA
ncbi:sigma factor, partial [Streptomyces sp. SID2888]